MKPYYQEKGITIYHGDCREILPTIDQVDLVLTDPPYGIGEANGKNKSRNNITSAKDYGIDISGGTFQVIRSTVNENGAHGVWVRNQATGSIENSDLRGNRRGPISTSGDCSVAFNGNLQD